MICPHCYAINHDSWKTCIHCKKSLQTATASFENLMKMIRDAEKERRK